ncbi:MAG: histidine phosphatase family protein [Granulosicoccus sp.]
MSTIHLVRHGQASAGSDDYDRLSELGREQSRLLGDWWHRQGFEAELALNGSLSRQRDTASISLDAAKLTPLRREHAGLNEYDHRAVDCQHGGGLKSDDPESMTFEDYVSIMQRWREASLDPAAGIAGGYESDSRTDIDVNNVLESWHSFAARGWQTVHDIHHEHDEASHLVFFTSGGVIATLLSQVLKLDFAHTIDIIWRIRNASITTLHYDGDKARMIDFNTIPHLQAEHDSSLITLI